MAFRFIYAAFATFSLGFSIAQAYEFSFIYADAFKSEATMKVEISAQLEKLDRQILNPLGMKASLKSVEKIFTEHHFTGVVEGQGCTPSLSYFQAVTIVQNYPIGVEPYVIQGIGIQWPASNTANGLPGLSRSLILVPLCLKQN